MSSAWENTDCPACHSEMSLSADYREEGLTTWEAVFSNNITCSRKGWRIVCFKVKLVLGTGGHQGMMHGMMLRKAVPERLSPWCPGCFLFWSLPWHTDSDPLSRPVAKNVMQDHNSFYLASLPSVWQVPRWHLLALSVCHYRDQHGKQPEEDGGSQGQSFPKHSSIDFTHIHWESTVCQALISPPSSGRKQSRQAPPPFWSLHSRKSQVVHIFWMFAEILARSSQLCTIDL